MFSSWKKKHYPSNSPPPNELPSSQVTHQPQSPTNSQSRSQSPQGKQQSQPIGPWSAHAPPFGQSPSPCLRGGPALSTSATAAGELFLFGGLVYGSKSLSNDLYVISTRDFSTTLLQTGGDAPTPRYGHRVVLNSTILLIWGGTMDLSNHTAQNQGDDDSFIYLLNLVSREWSRIVVNGPGPGNRYYHTMTLVGSKLFVFGGRTDKMRLNDIWALDLNCLTSNPFWESYEPTAGNDKPIPRAGHVSVATNDRIIIFGGCGGQHNFNDTWSFNVTTREWTELQCTGSVPSPRANHTAVLVDGVMYVFGGRAIDGTYLDDLTALNLLTQRWTAFQDIGSSPCGRRVHAMASDGRRIFVLGGALSPGAQVDDAKLIHVLDTKLLVYPEPDSDATQLAQKLSVGHPTQGQPQQPTLSSSDAHAARGASTSQKSTPEELDCPTSPQFTREQNPSLDSLSSRPTGASGPIRVPEDDDEGQGSTEQHAKPVDPGAPSGTEVARLEHAHLIELERQLSETIVAKTERDLRIAQLTEELALKGSLLEQATEEKRCAGLELRELQVKLDESLLSRGHALEQAQSALQKASSAAEANKQSQRELAEVHAKFEAKESELAAFRLRLADAENGWAKSKAEVDTYRNQTATGPAVNTDEDRVHRLMERVQTMEAEMALLRWNEKSFEMMECRNER